MMIFWLIYGIAGFASFVQSVAEQLNDPFDTDPLHVKFFVAVILGALWPVRLFRHL